jgi:ribonucleotide reductase alpha subunit
MNKPQHQPHISQVNVYKGLSQLDDTERFIEIDYNRDALLTKAAMDTARDQWMVEGEESPQECFARAACAFSDDSAHAQRINNYASTQWFMFATPLASNGGSKRGNPISCFLNKVGDSIKELGEHYSENLLLSTGGGGIAADWSGVRSIGTKTSRGNETTGVIPFIKGSDSLIAASWQGSCYVEGTEILTQRGWVEAKDLTEYDDIIDLNHHDKI